MLKAFPQFTRDFIRYQISYTNLLLLQSSIPPYRGIEDKKENNTATNTKNKKENKKVEHFNQIAEFF